MCQMCEFELKIHTFQLEMYKTVDFHSNLLVSWELVTEGYQGRPVKCAYFTQFKLKCTCFTHFH